MIGQVVGNFRVVAQLGRGGMGEVYRAEHTTVGTPVAIKVLGAELSADAQYVQRLFNEARAVARIRHPGVVQIFDVGTTPEGRAYLIMELLEGETVRTALVRGRFHATRIAALGAQIASVLEATHAVGITHRDLKPDNIFLVPDAHVAGGTRIKVLDFGIAKLTGTLHAQSPRTVGTMGTPAYMAPEQWGDPTAIDNRADLYSLGCVLFEMATGRPPFLVSTMGEACQKHMNELPPRAQSIAADVPAVLDELLARLLAKPPQARPTPREVIAALDGLREPRDPYRTQDTALPHVATVPQQQPAKQKSRVPLLVAALLGVLAIGGLVIAVSSSSSKATPAAAGSGSGSSTAPSTPAPAATSPAVPAPMIDEATLAFIEQSNPWVTERGVPIQTEAVRRVEYMRYVNALPADQRAAAKPLFVEYIDSGDFTAINWITFEQAERYCKAIGGKLLTSEQWEKLDAAFNGTGTNRGGRRLWTSTKTASGKAIVRGSFSEMHPSKIAEEKPWRFERDTEWTAGGRDPIEKVAGKDLGFRCSR